MDIAVTKNGLHQWLGMAIVVGDSIGGASEQDEHLEIRIMHRCRLDCACLAGSDLQRLQLSVLG